MDSYIRGFEVSSIHDNVKYPVRVGLMFVGQCHPRKPRKIDTKRKINETTVQRYAEMKLNLWRILR